MDGLPSLMIFRKTLIQRFLLLRWWRRREKFRLTISFQYRSDLGNLQIRIQTGKRLANREQICELPPKTNTHRSTRKNRQVVVIGNNAVGRAGKRRCALCRKRHQEVQLVAYSSLT